MVELHDEILCGLNLKYLHYIIETVVVEIHLDFFSTAVYLIVFTVVMLYIYHVSCS